MNRTARSLRATLPPRVAASRSRRSTRARSIASGPSLFSARSPYECSLNLRGSLTLLGFLGGVGSLLLNGSLRLVGSGALSIRPLEAPIPTARSLGTGLFLPTARSRIADPSLSLARSKKMVLSFPSTPLFLFVALARCGSALTLNLVPSIARLAKHPFGHSLSIGSLITVGSLPKGGSLLAPGWLGAFG